MPSELPGSRETRTVPRLSPLEYAAELPGSKEICMVPRLSPLVCGREAEQRQKAEWVSLVFFAFGGASASSICIYIYYYILLYIIFHFYSYKCVYIYICIFYKYIYIYTHTHSPVQRHPGKMFPLPRPGSACKIDPFLFGFPTVTGSNPCLSLSVH